MRAVIAGGISDERRAGSAHGAAVENVLEWVDALGSVLPKHEADVAEVFARLSKEELLASEVFTAVSDRSRHDRPRVSKPPQPSDTLSRAYHTQAQLAHSLWAGSVARSAGMLMEVADDAETVANTAEEAMARCANVVALLQIGSDGAPVKRGDVLRVVSQFHPLRLRCPSAHGTLALNIFVCGCVLGVYATRGSTQNLHPCVFPRPRRE